MFPYTTFDYNSKSIHAMVEIIKGLGNQVFDKIGIGALHNMTEIPFLTSDNPMIYFDPSIPEDQMKPYTLQPEGPIVLLFPVTPEILIYGNTSMHEQFIFSGFGDGELSDPNHVESINRNICRFAYKAVYSQKTGQEELIKKYAEKSPILMTETIQTEKGELFFAQNVFGKRGSKPKWRN
jgi:hypothetical protein